MLLVTGVMVTGADNPTASLVADNIFSLAGSLLGIEDSKARAVLDQSDDQQVCPQNLPENAGGRASRDTSGKCRAVFRRSAAGRGNHESIFRPAYGLNSSL
jgi:hypothetical protein